MNTPIGIAAARAGARSCSPGTPAAPTPARDFDALGAITVTAGLATFVYAVLDGFDPVLWPRSPPPCWAPSR